MAHFLVAILLIGTSLSWACKYPRKQISVYFNHNGLQEVVKNQLRTLPSVIEKSIQQQQLPQIEVGRENCEQDKSCINMPKVLLSDKIFTWDTFKTVPIYLKVHQIQMREFRFKDLDLVCSSLSKCEATASFSSIYVNADVEVFNRNTDRLITRMSSLFLEMNNDIRPFEWKFQIEYQEDAGWVITSDESKGLDEEQMNLRFGFDHGTFSPDELFQKEIEQLKNVFPDAPSIRSYRQAHRFLDRMRRENGAQQDDLKYRLNTYRFNAISEFFPLRQEDELHDDLFQVHNFSINIYALLVQSSLPKSRMNFLFRAPIIGVIKNKIAPKIGGKINEFIVSKKPLEYTEKLSVPLFNIKKTVAKKRKRPIKVYKRVGIRVDGNKLKNFEDQWRRTDIGLCWPRPVFKRNVFDGESTQKKMVSSVDSSFAVFVSYNVIRQYLYEMYSRKYLNVCLGARAQKHCEQFLHPPDNFHKFEVLKTPRVYKVSRRGLRISFPEVTYESPFLGIPAFGRIIDSITGKTVFAPTVDLSFKIKKGGLHVRVVRTTIDYAKAKGATSFLGNVVRALTVVIPIRDALVMGIGSRMIDNMNLRWNFLRNAKLKDVRLSKRGIYLYTDQMDPKKLK